MRTKLAVALLLMMVGSVEQARAVLLFSFNPAGLSGLPGDTVVFNATLTNTGNSQIFLNGDHATVSSSGLALDDSPFFANFPASLPGGDAITSDIFRVGIDPAVQPGNYTGSFTIVGGADANAQGDLVSQNFLVRVAAPTPEPESIYLMGIGIGSLAIWRRSLWRRP